jgi:hypothetical protein
MLTTDELARIKAMLVERRGKFGVSAARPIHDGLRLVAEVERLHRIFDPVIEAARGDDANEAIGALMTMLDALDAENAERPPG